MTEQRGAKNIITKGGLPYLKRWTVIDVPVSSVEEVKNYADTEGITVGRALTEIIDRGTMHTKHKEIIGLDYWQVISHYTDYFKGFAEEMLEAGHEIHIVSAVGDKRFRTVSKDIDKTGVPYTKKHIVLFDNPAQSPELKLEACKKIGITVFYDDRDDVCRLLNKNGIVAMRVTRKDNSTYDLESEIK